MTGSQSVCLVAKENASSHTPHTCLMRQCVEVAGLHSGCLLVSLPIVGKNDIYVDAQMSLSHAVKSLCRRRSPTCKHTYLNAESQHEQHSKDAHRNALLVLQDGVLRRSAPPCKVWRLQSSSYTNGSNNRSIFIQTEPAS